MSLLRRKPVASAIGLIALVFTLSTARAPLAWAAAVTNGGFESGLAGWTVVNAGSGNWFSHAGAFSPLTGQPVVPPREGVRTAITDQTGPGSHILYQDVALEALGQHTLSFSLAYHNYAGVGMGNAAGAGQPAAVEGDYGIRPLNHFPPGQIGAFFSPPTLSQTGGLNQQFRVDVIHPATPLLAAAPGDVLLNCYQTRPGDLAYLAPNTVSCDLTPFAGQTVRLRFAEVDNLGPFHVSLDAVQIRSVFSPVLTSVTISCTPTTLNPGATTPPNPATGGAAGNAGVLSSLCTLDFSDNGPTPTTVPSGLVVITVQGGAAANAVALSSNPATPLSTPALLDTSPQIGPTSQLRVNCPPPYSGARTPAVDSCDTISFVVALRPGVDPVIGPFGATTLRVSYDPDVDAANTGLTTDLAGPSVVPPPAPALRQPGFRVVCTTSVDPAIGLGLAPGQLPLGTVLGDTAATGAPFAIGTLPGGVPCQIQADADLSTVPVDPSAPGTIEVSALSGGLLDASGRYSTNLRIGCGDLPSIAAGVINLNTCVGVRFTVFGAGVGLVEIRFRYEPAAIAQAAGILEDEGAFTVGFVAPRADVSVLLNPNPVTVGATGTATARFNRTGLCAAGVVCIDPTTGLPITVTNGTILNGTVVFTIDNSAIASWVGAQTQTTTPISSTGFVTSANQATVRCGFFPTTQAPVQFTLGSFFGGCFEVAATYRGNAPGVTNLSATFTPDLPSASLIPFFSNVIAPPITNVRALEVVGAAPVGDVQLARGCNNVSPTVTEAASAYAARVNPTSALVAIWEHQAATNTFRGYSNQPDAPNDLAGVTRLRPVYVCTSGAATVGQPAA